MEFKWTTEKLEEVRNGLNGAKDVEYATFYKTEGDKSYWELTFVSGSEAKIIVTFENDIPSIQVGWETAQTAQYEPVEVVETDKDKLETWLDENGYNWDAYGFGEDTDYQIEGFTYNLTCYYDALSNEWELSTSHKGRYEKESDVMNPYADTRKADGNAVSRKTLKGVFNYIKKWTDK